MVVVGRSTLTIIVLKESIRSAQGQIDRSRAFRRPPWPEPAGLLKP